MNELQRQAYMQAMGVDCYMPRLQLPGAAVSQLCQLPVVDEKPSSTATELETDNAASPLPSDNNTTGNGSAAAMQALLGEPQVAINTAKVKAVDVEAEVSLASTPLAKQNIPHFSLSIVRGNNILLIDDGLQGHINPAEYLQLLQNMLFALGAGSQQLAIDAFVWPMVKNSHVDQSETAARQTLDAFLAKQVQQLQARFIILMGDTPASYIGEQRLPEGTLIEQPQLSVQVIRTLSASQMLLDPTVKAVVWAQLQPLYLALK